MKVDYGSLTLDPTPIATSHCRLALMRIVHVITRLIIGGAQENTLLTVEGLHHHYHDDVTLITGPAEGPEGDLFDRAAQLGLKVEVFPELVRPIRPIVDLKAYRRLRAAFRRLKPEVVHTHSSKAGILGRAAAWHEKVPAVVHTIHGMPFGPFETPLKNRLYIALERWAARRCHAIVSVCDAMTEQALAAGVGRPEQFLTVYSGMDADAFLDPPRSRQDVRRELGLADDEVAFATVARLFELKGHDDIVAVAARRARCQPQGPVRLDRRRHPPRPADRRPRAAAASATRSSSRAWCRRTAFPSCSVPSTRSSTPAFARAWRGCCPRPSWWAAP